MSKNNYWSAREKAWIDQNIISDREFAKKLDKYYSDLMKSISDDINRYYMSFAARDHISMDEAIKKVKDFDVKAFEQIAKKMVKESDFSDYANERLRVYNATMSINRLEMLKAQIGLELLDTDSKIEAELTKRLNDEYLAEVKRQSGILGKSKSRNIKAKVSEVINASFHGATWSQRLWVNHAELKAKLDSVITRSMVQGINPKTLASKLIPELNQAIKNKRFAAERLAITETARVQDQAQMDSFKANGYEYCVWVAEPSACEQCLDIQAQNDGIYKLDKVPSIPVHPSCRCSKSAYLHDNKLVSESGAVIHDWDSETTWNRDEEVAKKLYSEFTNRKLEPQLVLVAQNTGFSEEAIEKVFNHIFVNKHNFSDGRTEQFFPDY